MQEVQGSNTLGGNILCSHSPSEETLNRGPNPPIPIRIDLSGIKRSWHSTEGLNYRHGFLGIKIEMWVYFISFKFELDRCANNGDLLSVKHKRKHIVHRLKLTLFPYIGLG